MTICVISSGVSVLTTRTPQENKGFVVFIMIMKSKLNCEILSARKKWQMFPQRGFSVIYQKMKQYFNKKSKLSSFSFLPILRDKDINCICIKWSSELT